jgi:hypothetical protein
VSRLHKATRGGTTVGGVEDLIAMGPIVCPWPSTYFLYVKQRSSHDGYASMTESTTTPSSNESLKVLKAVEDSDAVDEDGWDKTSVGLEAKLMSPPTYTTVAQENAIMAILGVKVEQYPPKASTSLDGWVSGVLSSTNEWWWR